MEPQFLLRDEQHAAVFAPEEQHVYSLGEHDRYGAPIGAPCFFRVLML